MFPPLDKKIRTSSGMTLLEAVIYISLLAVISVAVVNVFLSETSAWARARAERDSTDAAKLILERITHEIRLASSADIGQSVFSSHPGKLVLNTFTSATTTDVSSLQIFLSEGELKLKRGTNPEFSLSGTNASTTRLVFYRIPSPKSELIRVELDVEVRVGHSTTTKSFITSAVLRGGY